MGTVQDRRVVVTGKIPGESRQTAEAKLRAAGAIVQSAVGKDTDVLVTGAAVGAKKLDKARELGVTIITWEQAFVFVTRDGVTTDTETGQEYPASPRAPMPAVRQWAPMLAKKTEQLPAGGNWLFEIKWDGIRGIATVKGGNVVIQSRSGLSDLTERYPWVVDELATLPDCVLDGELVALEGELAAPGPIGQGQHDHAGVERFVVFDVLAVDDKEVTGLTLDERRTLLHELVSDGVYVAVSPAFVDGKQLLSHVQEHGLEGVLAKKPSSRYVEGGRNDTWLKLKVRIEQEFVVLGYTAGEGSRSDTFGALVLGYFEDNEIRYAGKVGTGFDRACLLMLMGKMAPLIVDEYPWQTQLPRDVLKETREWLYPGIVVQIAYQRFTEDGLLWHPSYLKLRDDKHPSEVGKDA
jgi:bifunctional non-homologous end joining protein LigD